MTRLYILVFVTALGCFFSGCSPDSPENEMKSGISAFGKKDYSEAIERLTSAAVEIKDSTALFYTLGLSHLYQGDMEKALDALEKTVNLNPSHYEALTCLGQIAYYKNDLEDARKGFGMALKLVDDPRKKAVLYTSMALVESGLRNDGLARLYLIQAMQSDRSYAPALYNLGSLYRDKFKFNQEALDCFVQYAQLANQDDTHFDKAKKHIERLRNNVERTIKKPVLTRDAVAASEHLGKGVVFQAQKKYSDAIKEYDAALKADPLAFSAAYGKAMAYQKMKKSLEALAAFKEAIAINPDHQDSYIRAVTISMELKRYSNAARLLDKAIARNPRYSSYYDLMTRILYEQTRFPEAREYGYFYLSLLKTNDKGRAEYEKWVRALPES